MDPNLAKARGVKSLAMVKLGGSNAQKYFDKAKELGLPLNYPLRHNHLILQIPLIRRAVAEAAITVMATTPKAEEEQAVAAVVDLAHQVQVHCYGMLKIANCMNVIG